MDGWMDGWMDRWTDGCMDGWMNGYTVYGWMDGCINGWMTGKNISTHSSSSIINPKPPCSGLISSTISISGEPSYNIYMMY